MKPRPAFGSAPALWAALALFFLLAADGLLPAAASPDSPPFLVIFHTNDIHGHALETNDSEAGPAKIGFPRLKTFLNNYPAAHKLLVDAGDSLHGAPLATVRRGELMARLLSLMGYDALAAGNHDFDYGLPRLMELRDRYGLPFLAANIIEKEDGVPLLPSYLVKDFDGFKVGIFALSKPETPLLTAPGNVETVNFLEAEKSLAIAREMVRKLRKEEKVHLVLALTHLGSEPGSSLSSVDLAQNVFGLTMVVDGHSHRELGLIEGGTLIVSAGEYLEKLGVVEVRRASDGRLLLSYRLIPASDFSSLSPDPSLESPALAISRELGAEMDQVVAKSPISLNGETEEIRRSSTSLGRVTAAALLKATGADLAFINSGSIRASLPAGDITRGQLLNVLPFGNYAVTIQVSGAEILEAVRHGLSRSGTGGFPQFYGLNVTSIEGPERRQLVVEVGGWPLDREKLYTLATNDFLQSGGDGYQSLAHPTTHVFLTVEEILGRFLSETGLETLKRLAEEDVLTVIVEESP